jgi:hypothetical protein
MVPTKAEALSRLTAVPRMVPLANADDVELEN